MAYSRNVSPVGWYVASYLLRFVELNDAENDDPEKQFLVWENTILIQASDLDEAYDKIVRFGNETTRAYNDVMSGVDVRHVFEGVRELLPIYEEFADGSEIMWFKYKSKLKLIRKRVRVKGEFHQ